MPQTIQFCTLHRDFAKIVLERIGKRSVKGEAVTPAVREAVECVLATELSPREEEILRLRLEEGLKLEELGQRLNVTRERVRQIQNVILSKLEHSARMQALVGAVEIKGERSQTVCTQIIEECRNARDVRRGIAGEGKLSEATPCAALDIDTRTLNALIRNGLTTIADVLALESAEQLLSEPGIGKHVCEDIAGALERNGFDCSNLKDGSTPKGPRRIYNLGRQLRAAGTDEERLVLLNRMLESRLQKQAQLEKDIKYLQENIRLVEERREAT